MTLRDQLADAEAYANRLRRQIKAATCAEAGHDWKVIGGKNAGCEHAGRDCRCSVAVRECKVCGDCDYGDTEEADQHRQACAEIRGRL